MRPFFVFCENAILAMSESNPISERLQGLLAPLVAELGLELWGIEFRPSQGQSLLRIYIEAPGRPVAIEDCERVSREFSALLDVEDPIQGRFTLEVSSPGWERPLFTLDQYARYPGELVKIRLALPVDGRRRLQGRVLSVDAESVDVEVEGKPLRIPFGSIHQAKLSPDFETWKAQAAPAQPESSESPTPAAGSPRGRRKSS